MSITPQGYKYGIEPNTQHPFWGNGGESTNYKFYEFSTKTFLDNCSTNYNNVTLADDTNTVIVPIELLNVVVNMEYMIPFIYNDTVCYLVCEGSETNELSLTGVFSPAEITLSVSKVDTLPAPIKGDNGENGKDGVTPEITATATVNEITGVPSVQVTKSGTSENPSFEFAFTGLKGERGETGVTPVITATATVDETTGVPSVQVTKSGTAENTSFEFAFTGLKGEGGVSEKSVIPIIETLTTGGLKAGDIIIYDGQNVFDLNNDLLFSNTYFNSGNISCSTFASRSINTYSIMMGVITTDITGYRANIPLKLKFGDSDTHTFEREMLMEYNANANYIMISPKVNNKGEIVSVDSFSESEPYFRILSAGGFEISLTNTNNADFFNNVKVIR